MADGRKHNASIFGAMHPALHARQSKSKPIEKEIPKGPSRNPDYNLAFAVWQKAGLAPEVPECERCQTDLTGKQVYDCGEWTCYACSKDQA